jgi:hypothetical protein
MPEHYPKSVVEAQCWCDVCWRLTPHRIDDGRRGPCLIDHHPVKHPETCKRPEPEPAQQELFEGVTIKPTLKR